MTDTITLTGLVATEPRHLTTSEGLPVASFRLASTQRRYDRAKQTWSDGETNWYTITAFRQLASNAAGSVRKGERVIVTGRLRIKEWTNGDRTGTTVDIEAEAIGHDLTWGTASYVRSVSLASVVSAHKASEPPVTGDEFPESVDDTPEESVDDASAAPATEERVGAVPF